MKYRKILLLLVCILISGYELFARAEYDSLAPSQNIGIYGNIYHQHHDILDKAFSYQGLEIGAIVNQNLYLGVYGACFVSNLETKIKEKSQFVWIGQAGICGSYVFLKHKLIHPGCQLNVGYFALRYDQNDFGLFETNKAANKLNGIVLSPQIFGETEITNWFSIRLGLSYNFYFFDNHTTIRTSDLNYLSFTFGMLFK